MPYRSILPRSPGLLQAAALILLALLAGCETPGVRPDAGELESRAQASFEAGNYAQAAQAYERLASRAEPAQRDQWLIAAAESWYFATQRNRAMKNMRAVRRPIPASLNPAQSVLAAAVEVENGAHEAALQRLRALPAGLDRGIGADALAVGSSAWFALGDGRRGAELLIEREQWLDTADQVLANQRRLWEGLRAAGESEIPAGIGAELRGWLELSNAVAAHAGDAFGERAAMLRWLDTWPDHPGAEVLLPQLLGDYHDSLKIPQRVALLLPLSGRVSQASIALRDGFIAAHYDVGDAVLGTQIVIYDTAMLGAENAYRTAVAEGADFVVGPLLKDDIEAILPLVPAGPTTLALNYLPEHITAPRNLFQFALAPEHEARRVAQRATAEGLRNAIALVPASDWGHRVLRAFTEELEQQGGTLLTHSLYDPASTDFSTPIQSALLLDRSQARYRAVAATVGQRLEFEPRRREDVQFIFLGAFVRQARLMRPQLRFHYASNLPVYATAAAYDPDPSLNRDIEGLVIATTPWEIGEQGAATGLQQVIDRYWPKRTAPHNPLYAMGYDAWRLVPVVARGADGVRVLPGLTGELSISADGRILRYPSLARIEDGVAMPLEQLGEPVDTTTVAQDTVTAP